MADLNSNEKEILVCALIEVYIRSEKLHYTDIADIASKLNILPQLAERMRDLKDVAQN